jgi:hypothetical protein
MMRQSAILGITLCLSACVNLSQVRDFATESAKLSAYTELTTRFRDTFERETPYLNGENLKAEAQNDKGRKEIYPDLIKIHERVSLYLRTLAKLAGEDTFDLSKPITGVGDVVKENPVFGIGATQAEAYTNVGKIIAKWATSSAQQRAVRDMVREGDPAFQTLVGGMGNLVRLYRKTSDQEEKIVMGFFDVNMALLNPSQDMLLASLAQEHLQDKKKEYSAVNAKFDDAEQGILKIAEGHAALVKNVDDLSVDEVQTTITRLQQDIKIIRENLQSIRH